LCAAGFALNSLAHSIVGLVLCMALFTFGEMITMPTYTAYVAELAPPNMRGRYMGASGFTWAIGLITGPALGMKLFAASPTTYWIACAILGAFAAAVISIPPSARSCAIKA
jgi:MFS family permease